MGDGYTARFSRRWRLLSAIGSVAVSVPVLVPSLPESAAARLATAALVLAQAAGFWWLGIRPLPGTAVVLAAGAGLQALYPNLGPGLAFVVLCTYAWLRPAAESLWGLALAIVAACAPAVARGRWEMAGLWLGGVALAWSWGALVRARGARRLAERRQAVLEERARIARELHDVLSHTVSVMVVQAAAADDVFDLDPARAREALRRTEQAGRQALSELRWFLRTVRADDEPSGLPLPILDGPSGLPLPILDGPSGPARVTLDGRSGLPQPILDGPSGPAQPPPQPTLADVERLAETVSAAGLPVSVRREGDGGAEVPLAVQLSAYRIVQEALTNTLRHAGAGRAEVLVRIEPSQVYVQVRDNGRGGTGVGSGQGIPGMRERAALLGGTLRAGPAPGGGFEIGARLPLGERS